MAVKRQVEFKVKVTDKASTVLWVEGLKFSTSCLINYSNNVTSGPYAEATYETMDASGF